MSKEMSLHLVHLYPQEMNIYGDNGNRLVLTRRAEWRGVKVRVSMVGVGQKIPADADLILGGGAQDAVQKTIEKDLASKAKVLRKLANDDVPMLMVCGMYQLFGKKFITNQGDEIKGIGIFDLETVAGSERFIGNTIYQTPWGEIIGYENHSGLTNLADTATALGSVTQGAGNNGHDNTEGCVFKSVFGTYSHGPVLSKNPRFADELLGRALARKYDKIKLKLLDNELELTAAATAKARPR